MNKLNSKGVFSFDFILALIVFLLAFSFFIGFVNDLETTNESVVENIQNYDVYLTMNDYIHGTANFENWTGSAELKFYSDSCILNNKESDSILRIIGLDNNFSVSNYSGEMIDKNCTGIIKFIQ